MAKTENINILHKNIQEVEPQKQLGYSASGTDDDDINNKQFNSNYDMTGSKLQARFDAKKFMEREKMKLSDIESSWKHQKYYSPIPPVVLGVVPKMSPSDSQLISNDSSNFNYIFPNTDNKFAPSSLDKRSMSRSLPIHYNDQLSKEKNDLFESEANSKLSKKEQDQKQPQPQPQANRELKRDVDGKIKLKISNKLMKQGLSAELPSDVYGFDDIYSKIKSQPTLHNIQEVQANPNDYQFKKIPNYNRFKRESNLRKLMSNKNVEIKIDENGKIFKAKLNSEINTNDDDDRQTNDKSTSNNSQIPTVQNNVKIENFNYYDDVDDDNYSNNNYNSFDDEKDDPTTTIETEMKNDNNESKFVGNLLIDKSKCSDNATITTKTHASMQQFNNEEKMHNIESEADTMKKREYAKTFLYFNFPSKHL